MITQPIKTIKGLKTFFQENIKESEEIEESKRVMYMDPAKVLGIIPKITGFKKLLINNFEVKETNFPEMNYNKDGNSTKCKYSTEYLKEILKFLTITNLSESTTIGSKQEYPLWIENPEFIILLAPIVEN